MSDTAITNPTEEPKKDKLRENLKRFDRCLKDQFMFLIDESGRRTAAVITNQLGAQIQIKELSEDLFVAELFTRFKSIAEKIRGNYIHYKDIVDLSKELMFDLKRFTSVSPKLLIEEGDPNFNLAHKIIPNVIPSEDRSKIPFWNDFLDRLTDPTAYAAWIWSLYQPRHQGRQMLYIHGGGEDGKSLACRVVASQVGKPFAQALGTKELKSSSNHGLSTLDLARLITITDSNNDTLLGYESLKNLTGGDEIVINKKGQPQYSKKIDCRIYIISNKQQKIEDNKFEKSRVLYLEISPKTSPVIPDWEQKLHQEYQDFLSFCKFSYQERCPDHYHIQSAVSDQKIQEIVSDGKEDLLETVNKYFEIDRSKNWKVVCSTFSDKLNAAKLNAFDVQKIKQALGLKPRAQKINGVQYRFYDGIRSKTQSEINDQELIEQDILFFEEPEIKIKDPLNWGALTEQQILNKYHDQITDPEIKSKPKPTQAEIDAEEIKHQEFERGFEKMFNSIIPSITTGENQNV